MKWVKSVSESVSESVSKSVCQWVSMPVSDSVSWSVSESISCHWRSGSRQWVNESFSHWVIESLSQVPCVEFARGVSREGNLRHICIKQDVSTIPRALLHLTSYNSLGWRTPHFFMCLIFWRRWLNVSKCTMLDHIRIVFFLFDAILPACLTCESGNWDWYHLQFRSAQSSRRRTT